MDLSASMRLASSGMKAQSSRMRVSAENLANADSTSQIAGGNPYQRKTIFFKNVMDRKMGIEMVEVDRYGRDPSQFEMRYEPSHPAANNEGNVLYPNVNPLIELMDMREAQRSFEANLAAMRQARGMMERMLETLRS